MYFSIFRNKKNFFVWINIKTKNFWFLEKLKNFHFFSDKATYHLIIIPLSAFSEQSEQKEHGRADDEREYGADGAEHGRTHGQSGEQQRTAEQWVGGQKYRKIPGKITNF